MVEPNKDIPQDITDQILLCLPVKSVTRFKCVCKSWKSLITRPSFTRNHFKRARSQNPKIINDQKLLIPLCGGFRSLDLEKYSFDERPTILIPKNGYYRILGSCHGLICLLGEIDLRFVIFLWNPCTGEYKKLPHCNIFPLQWYFFNFYGFGYDSSSDDYKLLLSSGTKTLVFSLVENLWRTVHEGPMLLINSISPFFYNDRGVYSNGALHWNFDLDSLCTFDLRMERFHYGPRLDASIVGHRWKLFGTGETLNCWGIKKGIYSFDFELWLMEKNCLEGTWTKVLCIPCSSDLPNLFENLLCISEGNGFISAIGEDIIRYDFEGGILQKIKMGNIRHANYPMAYSETLVSPHPHIYSF